MCLNNELKQELFPSFGGKKTHYDTTEELLSKSYIILHLTHAKMSTSQCCTDCSHEPSESAVCELLE